MITVKHIVALSLVCIFMFLLGLGSMALTDPDETFYAQTAKEMLQADEWITPTIFGQPQFEKPVLYYWLIELSYKAFGINEFAARLPSAVFAVMGIFGIYLLGRLIFTPLTGFLSGLVMATCIQYVMLARASVTDMVLLVCILLCLLFFLLGTLKKGKVWYLLSAVMAALAVMTKGPIGLFIPGTIMALYFVTGRRWRDLKNVPVFWSVLVFLAVCAPWYFMAAKIHGISFISEFFGFQNVTRFLQPEHRIGSSPVFYLPVILGGIFPWTTFFLFGAWLFYARDKFVSRIEAHKFFLACWFLVVFLFFSISRTKLVTYIFPLFPVMAIIAGRFWERGLSVGTEGNGITSRLLNIAHKIFVGSSFVGFVGMFLFVRYKYPDMAVSVLWCGAAFLAGVFLSIFFFRRRKIALCFSSIILAVVLLMVSAQRWVLPVITRYESSKGLAVELKKIAGENDPIGGEDDHRRGVAFYTDRANIEDIHAYDSLIEFVSRKERVWGIIKVKHYKQLKDQQKDLYLETVAVQGKYVIITNMPYKELSPNEGEK